jgi:protein-tyrosine phosphatase
MTDDALQPGASIRIASLPNLRDLGGWPTAGGGHVRRGLLYRSTDLGKLSDADMPAVAALGLRAVYDLRTEAERTAEPDRVPAGADHVVLDVLADVPGAGPAQLLAVLSDPAAAAAELGAGRGAAIMAQAYGEIIGLGSALRGYRRLFADLAQERNRPALFHCTTGKDRTGWASAAMLMLMGVSDDDVMTEYLLTNDQLLPALQPVFDRFASAGGDPELLRSVLGVEPGYLEAALDEMRGRYGTIAGYFTDGLGLDAEVQAALRDAFVDRS